MSMPPILAADPGLTTGWAVYHRADQAPVAGETPDPMEFLTQATEWAGKTGGHGIIVAERFVITPETAKKTAAPWSLEVSGGLRFIAHRYDLEFVQQSPSEAKRLIHDRRLKALGWWHPGQGHANDALRHLAFLLARRRVLRLPATQE